MLNTNEQKLKSNENSLVKNRRMTDKGMKK